MRIIELNENSKKDLLKDLLKRSPSSYGSFEATVNEIIENVKENGDEAIFAYTKKFDKFDLNKDNIRVTRQEIDAAYQVIDKDLIEVYKKSAENVRVFHEKQLRNSWIDTKEDGSILGQRITPIERAGRSLCSGR